MKRGKALLAIFSAGLLLTACGNPSKKGVEYLEKGEYDQAVEQFEQAIEKNKNTGDAWRGIGIVNGNRKIIKGQEMHSGRLWIIMLRRQEQFTISSETVI